MSDVFLTFFSGLLGGLVAFFTTNWSLSRKVTQLEFDLYSLVERVNTEVKRRASAAGKKAKEFDEEVIRAAQNLKSPLDVTPAPPAFWWAPFVGKRNESG